MPPASSRGRKPDFFIVGAGRSGTTAMYEYLSAHSSIFMSPVKEPRFFAEDMPGLMNRVGSLPDYLALFRGAGEEHLVVGEASPQYLYSSVAISRIRDFSPRARLLVMLRNPVDMAHSAHAECRYWFVEDEPDFEAAWRLQAERRRGESMPKLCSQVTVLLWSDMCRLGEQVGRLLDVFPREQVKFILFEDFVADTRGAYEEVLDFVGVSPDGREDFPPVRSNRSHRMRWIGRLLVRPPAAADAAMRPLQRSSILRGAASLALALNTRSVRRRPLAPEFRRELVEEFREDVDKLAELIGHDLRHWHA